MGSKLLNTLMNWGDKVGLGGIVVAGAGCAACFPALAGLGAAVGLGFLNQWEPLLVGTFIPLIAVLVIVINAGGWFRHRQWHRSALGMAGPTLILIGALTMRESFFYPGLAVMLGISLWDLFSARNRRCEPGKAGMSSEG